MEECKVGDKVEIRIPWYKKVRAWFSGVDLPPRRGVLTRNWQDSSDDSVDVVDKSGDKFRIAAEYVHPFSSDSDEWVDTGDNCEI